MILFTVLTSGLNGFLSKRNKQHHQQRLLFIYKQSRTEAAGEVLPKRHNHAAL